MKKFLFILVVLLIFWFNGRTRETVRHLYMGNDTQTDLMWNGKGQGRYQQSLDMARFYISGEATLKNLPEARSKWNHDDILNMESQPVETRMLLSHQIRKGASSTLVER